VLCNKISTKKNNIFFQLAQQIYRTLNSYITTTARFSCFADDICLPEQMSTIREEEKVNHNNTTRKSRKHNLEYTQQKEKQQELLHNSSPHVLHSRVF
jgi:hypothetical protein